MGTIYVYRPDTYLKSEGGLDFYLLAYSAGQYDQDGGAFRASAPKNSIDSLLDLNETKQTVTIGGNFADPDEYNFSLSIDASVDVRDRKPANFKQSKSALTFREGGTVNFIADTGDKDICADDEETELSDTNIKFLVKNIYLPDAGLSVKSGPGNVVSLDAYGISAASTIQRTEKDDHYYDVLFDKDLTFETDFSAKFDVSAQAVLEGMTDVDKDGKTVNVSNVSGNTIQASAARAENITIKGHLNSNGVNVTAEMQTNTASIIYDNANFDIVVTKEKHEKYVAGIDESEQLPIYYYSSGDLYFVPKYHYVSHISSTGSADSNGTIFFDWNSGSPQIFYYPESGYSRRVQLYIDTDGKYRFAEDFNWYDYHFTKGELVDAESGGINALPITPDENDLWGDTWKKFGTSTNGDKEILQNQIRSVGLWAENDMKIDGRFTGSITAQSNENMISDLSENYEWGNSYDLYDTDKKLTDTSDNTISSYGLYSANGTISLGGASVTAVITTQANENTLICEPDPGTDDEGFSAIDSSTMSGNQIESIGIKGKTLTVDGIFDGIVNSYAQQNLFYLNDKTGSKESLMSNSDEASGIHVAGNLTTTDRFGGTITVIHSAASEDNTSASTAFDYKTAGIFADGNLTVNKGKGSFDTTISVTSDLLYMTASAGADTGADPVYGVKTNIFKAEAFTGNITVDGRSLILAALDDAHVNYGLYATEYANGFDNTFDILGTIDMRKALTTEYNYAIYGDYSNADPNLRLAGTITVTDPEFDYAFQRGTANNIVGSVTLAASANIQGKVNALFGRNVVYVDSNARLNGDITTDYGTRSVEFVLNRFGGLGKAADVIPVVDASDDVLDNTDAVIHSYGKTLATSGLDMAINLNAADNGTYVLFDNLTETQINKGWKGLSVTFKYDKQPNLKSVVQDDGTIETEIGNINIEAFSREKSDGTYQICLEVSGVDPAAKLSADAVLTNQDDNKTTISELTASKNQDAHTVKLTWKLSTIEAFKNDTDKSNIRFELEYWKSDVCEPGQSIVININATDSRYYNNTDGKWSVTLENVYDDTVLNYRIRAVRGDQGLPNSLSSIGAWTDDQTITMDDGPYAIDPIVSTDVKDPNGQIGITNAITELRWNDVSTDCEAGFKDYTVQFFFSEELFDETEKSSKKLSEIWKAYDDHDPELTFTVYEKTTTTNKVLLSGLDETQYVYWRVKANDLKGNSNDWKLGQTFIENRNDATAPQFPNPADVLGIGEQFFSVNTENWYRKTDPSLIVNWYNIALDNTFSRDDSGKIQYTGIYQYVFTYCEDGTEDERFQYVSGRETDYKGLISLTLTGAEMPKNNRDYNWNISAMDFANLTSPKNEWTRGIIYGDKTAPETTPGDAEVAYDALQLPEGFNKGDIFSGEVVDSKKNTLRTNIVNNSRINVNFSISAEDIQREGLEDITYNISGVDRSSYAIHFIDGETETEVNLDSNVQKGETTVGNRHIEYEWTTGGNSVDITMNAPNSEQSWYFTLNDNAGNKATSDEKSSGTDTLAPNMDNIELHSEMIGGTADKVGIRVNWKNAVDIPQSEAVGASGLYFYELQLYSYDEGKDAYSSCGENYHVLVIADPGKTDEYEYEFTGLDYGAYGWAIQACDSAGNFTNAPINEIIMDSIIFDDTYLSVPVVTETELHDFSVYLSWNPAQSISSVESYTVSYRPKNTETWTEATITGTSTSYTIDPQNLLPETTYEWKVDAANSNQQTKTAYGQDFTLGSIPERLALSLTADPKYENDGSFTVTLNWVKTSGADVSEYSLLYAAPDSEIFNEIASGITVTSMTMHDFGKYKISAKDPNYAEMPRSSNMITVLKDITEPEFEEGAEATSEAAQDGFTLTWSSASDPDGAENEVVSGMKQYKLYFNTTDSLSNAICIETGSTETSYSLTKAMMISAGITSGNYFWWVSAVDIAGNEMPLAGTDKIDIDVVGPTKTKATVMNIPTITVEYNLISEPTDKKYDGPEVRDPSDITVTFDVSNNTYTDKNGKYDAAGKYNLFVYEIADDTNFQNILYSTIEEKGTEYDGNTLTLSTANNGIARLAGYEANHEFYWRIRAVDTLGNYAEETEPNTWGASFTLVDPNIKYDDGHYAPIQDLYTNPTTPTDLTVTNAGNNDVTLNWTPSSDAFGIDKYEIMVTNKSTSTTTYEYVYDVIGTTRVSTANLEDLDSGAYQFKIRAYDGSGRASSWSSYAYLNVIDLTKPANPAVTVKNYKTTFTWDKVVVPKGIKVTYQVLIDNNPSVTVSSNKYTYTFKDTAVGDHTFSVRAVAGDTVSDWAVTEAEIVDVTPPKAGALTVTQPKPDDDSSKVTLTWTEGSDNVGIAKYVVTCGDQEYEAGPDELEYTFTTGLDVGTRVTATLTAYDEAENASKTIKKTITLKDVTPPDQVTGLYVEEEVDNKSGGVLAWEPAYDNVGVTQYLISVEDEDGKTTSYKSKTNSVKLKKLTAGDYKFTVVALDKAKNESIVSDECEFTVADVIDPKIKKLSAKVKNDTAAITWSATDETEFGSVSLTLDSEEPQVFDAESGTLDLQDLSAGTHTLHMTAYDAAGNFAEKEISFKIKGTLASLS